MLSLTMGKFFTVELSILLISIFLTLLFSVIILTDGRFFTLLTHLLLSGFCFCFFAHREKPASEPVEEINPLMLDDASNEK